MRDIARNYFSLFQYNIKIFFIELKNIWIVIYIKGDESIIPGIYIKTIKSMEYINNNYEYDYVIRTNLSSFWNLNKALEMKPLLPKEIFCGGIINYHSQTFISGTGIMLSKDICQKLVNLGIIETEYNDDVIIVMTLTNNLNLQLMSINDLNYTMKYYIDNVGYIPDNNETIL